MKALLILRQIATAKVHKMLFIFGGTWIRYTLHADRLQLIAVLLSTQ